MLSLLVLTLTDFVFGVDFLPSLRTDFRDESSGAVPLTGGDDVAVGDVWLLTLLLQLSAADPTLP